MDSEAKRNQAEEASALYDAARGSGVAAVLAFSQIALTTYFAYWLVIALRARVAFQSELLSSDGAWEIVAPAFLAFFLWFPTDRISRVIALVSMMAAGVLLITAAVVVQSVPHGELIAA